MEGVLPPDPGGRSGGGALGSAGLGDGRESERPGLEGNRADAGLRPPGRLPPGALRSLLRHAPGGAGRSRRPADAQHRPRRRRRAGKAMAPPAAARAGASAIATSRRGVRRDGGRRRRPDGAAPPTRSRPPMPRPRSCSGSRGRSSVDNGRTLSLPILDRQVPAQRLALYQAETAARNPLAAMRLTNDGDTRPAARHHDDLRARTRRATSPMSATRACRASRSARRGCLAYALDEKITIERDAAQTDRIATGTIVAGRAAPSRVMRQTTTYRVRGPAKEAAPARRRAAPPRRAGRWSSPSAKGRRAAARATIASRSSFRAAIRPQTFEVVQEQTQQQELRLVDGAADQIRRLRPGHGVRRQDPRGADQDPAAARPRSADAAAQGHARPTPSASRSSRSRRACATTSRACRPTATCSGAISRRSTSRRPTSRRSPSAGRGREGRRSARDASDYVSQLG